MEEEEEEEGAAASLKRGSRSGTFFFLLALSSQASFSSAENAAFKSRSASFPRVGRAAAGFFLLFSLPLGETLGAEMAERINGQDAGGRERERE
jgi:hypothetical protein